MTTRSSGDLAADRRFGYGQGCLADGDPAAAADLFRQALELVPEWPPAWFALGEALERAGQAPEAAEAFGRALALQPGDELGAGLHLARLGSRPVTDAMSPVYVAALFDQYADRFDGHLVSALDYRGPAIVVAALEEACRALKRPCAFNHALDLGCGTGLMARELEGRCKRIDGCDLAPAMIAAARRTGFYKSLGVNDAVDALAAANCLDLVVAADVLVYIGDLSPLFAAVKRALDREGLFAFTVQSCAGDHFQLGHDLRFHHSAHYIRASAANAGLAVVSLADCVTRQDAGSPVPGFVAVLRRGG